MVGINVPGNASPPWESSLHATLNVTLTPCKSMEGGLEFQKDSHSFHTGVMSIVTSPFARVKQVTMVTGII